MRKLLCFYWLFMSQMVFAANPPLPSCSIAGPNATQSQNILAALTAYPTPAFYVMDIDSKAQFLPPSRVYADFLQTSERSIIINSTEELRFLSQTLAHSNILLILDGRKANDFDAEKSKKVMSVAKLLDIKVSMLWLSDKPSPKTLKDMVANTGGASFGTKDLLQHLTQLCAEKVASR